MCWLWSGRTWLTRRMASIDIADWLRRSRKCRRKAEQWRPQRIRLNELVMKTLIIVLLLFAGRCSAGDSSDISRKVFEKRGKDGKVSFRMETTYRGTKKVMMETFGPDANGVMVISSRSYVVGGALVMTEAGEHKSGKLDTIAVYHPGSHDMEFFSRRSDGSVKPVSTETLQA